MLANIAAQQFSQPNITLEQVILTALSGIVIYVLSQLATNRRVNEAKENARTDATNLVNKRFEVTEQSNDKLTSRILEVETSLRESERVASEAGRRAIEAEHRADLQARDIELANTKAQAAQDVAETAKHAADLATRAYAASETALKETKEQVKVLLAQIDDLKRQLQIAVERAVTAERALEAKEDEIKQLNEKIDVLEGKVKDLENRAPNTALIISTGELPAVKVTEGDASQ